MPLTTLDYTQLINQIVGYVSVGSLVGIGVFIGTTRTQLKHLKEKITETKTQIDNDIDLKTENVRSPLDGKIDVVEARINNRITTCEQKILKLEEKNGDMGKEITKIEDRLHKIYESAYNNVSRDLNNLLS